MHRVSTNHTRMWSLRLAQHMQAVHPRTEGRSQFMVLFREPTSLHFHQNDDDSETKSQGQTVADVDIDDSGFTDCDSPSCQIQLASPVRVRLT